GDELEGVAVAGDHQHVPSGSLALGGEGGDDVVGLEAVHRDGGDAHGLHDLDDEVDLAVELLGRLVAPALVFRVLKRAEGGRVQIEGHHNVGGLLLADHGQQHGGEAVN